MSLIGATNRQSSGIERKSSIICSFVAALRTAGILEVHGQRIEGHLLLAAHSIFIVLPIGQEINVGFALLVKLVVFDSVENTRKKGDKERSKYQKVRDRHLR